MKFVLPAAGVWAGIWPRVLANHHEIVIIEPVESQCRMLADMLDIPVICGDSISVDTLRTADVASCDAFVA